MRFLLDTNIVSDLMRNPRGRVAARVAEVAEDSVCTSIIVAAELRYGAAKKGSADLSRRVEAVLETFDVIALKPPVDVIYAELRARLEKAGRPVGANDLFVAAHALALGCTLVTANEREFSRVRDLRLENWLRDRV
jgi:tRNA(fMet)-specific endonuclease VapC